MRVEAYTQINQIYQTTRADKSQKKEKTSFSDQLEISSLGKDYQTAKQAVVDSADIREEVTAPLKKSIQSGTYEVNTEKFAEKLIKKYEMR